MSLSFEAEFHESWLFNFCILGISFAYTEDRKV